MFNHLQSLTFFGRSALGHGLQYFSAYAALQQGGLDGLLNLLQHVLAEQKPTLLVIDGMLYIEALAESIIAVKEFTQTVHAFMEVARCTAVLLGMHVNSQEASAIATTVDGVIELGHRLVGSHAVRTLHVDKFRGSDFIDGLHMLQIVESGIVVHPRLESVLKPTADIVPGQLEKLPTGITELDQMLEGGLPSGSATVVLGVPGSGKTPLGVTFLTDGARHDQPGLYFGFSETPSRLIAKADRIGLDVGQHVADGRIALLWQPAEENTLDILGERLLEAVRRRQVGRVFIDGVVSKPRSTMRPGLIIFWWR